ncbi:hypothetical protein FPV67DRAFT_1665498 [Lyophyllum atratum]|nr:hypothetical protein FPV67DRAFT_1665498 [Lyophyllum atratum]
MTISVTIRRLESPSDAEVKRVVDVLLAAFGEDDPITNFLVGGGEVHVASLGPEVNNIVGAAVWYGPGQVSMSTEEQREVGSKKFFAKCPEELKKWWREHFLPSIDRLADESLGPGFKEAQWSLLLFGVVPNHQRRGIAKAMMRVAEDRAKADGVSIVLETTTELDLVIYQRLGLEVKGQVTLTCPLGSTPVYQLMKTP